MDKETVSKAAQLFFNVAILICVVCLHNVQQGQIATVEHSQARINKYLDECVVIEAYPTLDGGVGFHALPSK